MKFIVIESEPIIEYERDEEGNYPLERDKNKVVIKLDCIEVVEFNTNYIFIKTKHGSYRSYVASEGEDRIKIIYDYYEWLRTLLMSL